MTSFFKRTRIGHWQNIERHKLKESFERSRKRNKISISDRHCIERRRRDELLAVNSHSRTHWGKAVCEELARIFCGGGDGSSHDQEILYVTLCDKQCIRSSESLSETDLAWIKSRLRRGLLGLNYFAVVEPALYVNWQVGHERGSDKKCVAWHAHALVWGISKKHLKKRLSACRRSGWYERFDRGFRPTYVEPVKSGGLPAVVGYLLKSPISAYRVSVGDLVRDGKEVVNASGEVLQTYRQSKSALRLGERLTLFFALRHLYLDRLAFAGREGRTILSNAKRIALPRPTPPRPLPGRFRRRPGSAHVSRAADESVRRSRARTDAKLIMTT